jgi:hypothetical protein
MAFGTTLINKLTQNLDQRLADRRARQLQEQQMQDQLKQNQLLFEQQQRQQLQAQPQQLQMKENEYQNTIDMKRKFMPQEQELYRKQKEFEKKVKEDFAKLPPVSDPEYVAAMRNNDFPKMYQIAAQKPELMPHLEKYYTMIGKHQQEYKRSIDKVTEMEKIKTAGAKERAGFRSSGGGSSSGKASNKQSSQLKNLYMIEKDAYGDLKSELKDMLEPKSGFDQDGPEIAEKRSEVESARRRVNQLRSDYQSSLGSGDQGNDDADALIEGLKKLVNPSAGNNNINIVPITEEEFNGKPAATKKNPAKPAAPSTKKAQPAKHKEGATSQPDYESLLDRARVKRYNEMKRGGMKTWPR